MSSHILKAPQTLQTVAERHQATIDMYEFPLGYACVLVLDEPLGGLEHLFTGPRILTAKGSRSLPLRDTLSAIMTGSPACGSLSIMTSSCRGCLGGFPSVRRTSLRDLHGLIQRIRPYSWGRQMTMYQVSGSELRKIVREERVAS